MKVDKPLEPPFWVVVPFFNEEKLLRDTLDSLARQSDLNFHLLLVDNNSTDRSRAVIDTFADEHPEVLLDTVVERQKGTGAASDTGFRHAIASGARIVARTDADSVPCVDWIAFLKRDFRGGARIVGGKVEPRTDEQIYRWYDGVIGSVLIGIIERAPRYLYKRPGQRYPMFMVPGLNMAIDADLYLAVGGFPRSSIDDIDEDLELHLKVCQVIDRHEAVFDREAVVRCSIRKGKALGYLGILLWYWNRKKKAVVVDVR